MKASFYLPQLDVLRFCAFLMVFIHHSFPNVATGYPGPRWFAKGLALVVRSGNFGVDLFFVLSSYLITELLVREVEANGVLDVKAFYIRRALRIWPLYFGFVGGGYLLATAGVPIPRLTPVEFVAFMLLVGNWWVAYAGYPVMAFAPLWSLCLEEQFYLLWPLAVRRLRVRGLRVAAVAMIVIAILVRSIMVAKHMPEHTVWCFTLSRLDPIGAGVLLALVRRPILGHWLVNVAIGLAGIVAAQGLLAVSFIPHGLALVPSYALVAASCALLISGVIHAKPPRTAWMRGLIYLGKVSFGLYVFHYAVLLASQALFPVKSAVLQVTRNGGALVLTVLIATASYELFEKRFLKLKERFSRIPSRAP